MVKGLKIASFLVITQIPIFVRWGKKKRCGGMLNDQNVQYIPLLGFSLAHGGEVETFRA